MTQARWILYGANGYTGKLTAEAAAARGLRPILAGRREEAVRPIAERLGLEWRAFSLDDPAGIARQLEGVAAILLDAGPFSVTSAPVVEACLRARAHYLDITGEIPVLEACFARDAEARARGVVILPGVGFDVVPTDCLAVRLKEALPDAVELELAVAGGQGGPSRGTAKTAVEIFARGGKLRRDGRLVDAPIGALTQEIPFRDKRRHAVAAPWADLSTAWRSTGIPNITVYFAMRREITRWMPLLRPLLPALAWAPVRRRVQRRLERIPGPTEEQRRTLRTHIWGRVANASGRAVEATLETPEPYALTVTASLACVMRLLTGGVEPGATTPARAFGWRLVTELEGCDLQVIEERAGQRSDRESILQS